MGELKQIAKMVAVAVAALAALFGFAYGLDWLIRSLFRVPCPPWIPFLAILVLGLVCAVWRVLGVSSRLAQVQRENESMRSERADLEQANSGLGARVAELESEKRRLVERARELLGRRTPALVLRELYTLQGQLRLLASTKPLSTSWRERRVRVLTIERAEGQDAGSCLARLNVGRVDGATEGLEVTVEAHGSALAHGRVVEANADSECLAVLDSFVEDNAEWQRAANDLADFGQHDPLGWTAVPAVPGKDSLDPALIDTLQDQVDTLIASLERALAGGTSG